MGRFQTWGVALALLAGLVVRAGGDEPSSTSWRWATGEPAAAGMDAAKLEAAWSNLLARRTTAFLVVRNDTIVFERYTPGQSRTSTHYTASLAKALVGGVSLVLAMGDERIKADDPASLYLPSWRDDTRKRTITIAQLATHTSGIEDAEEGETPHDQLTGWKGSFWKRMKPPEDPFTIARDQASVKEVPGTRVRYSNPGMALLGYCVTASLAGTATPDLRALLATRVMEPLGVPRDQWSVGYNQTTTVDGLPLVACWGGGNYSPDAVARVGRLLLHEGEWNGQALLDPAALELATGPSGLPGHGGLGFWLNAPNPARLWPSAPDDAFGGAGAGQQFLLVVPSLDLVVVRFGGDLDSTVGFAEGLDRQVVEPVIAALQPHAQAPYPASPLIRGVEWAPVDQIVRLAQGGDNWPLTWGPDDALYTAYGDGRGFQPFVPGKLSLGFARVDGPPTAIVARNIRSESGERTGQGPAGEKASGLLMVDGTLWMWVRNAGNSRLAWSSDQAASWNWCAWRFTEGFGCPTFLNHGKDHAPARDAYVYTYSMDGPSAYEASDQLVLARVLSDRIASRDAYEFFAGLDSAGEPIWTPEIERRQGVFRNPGRCYRSSVSYSAGLTRYLLCQILPGADPRFAGGFGIYDAPEPWGPWTTVFYTEAWDVGPGESCSLPAKWMSDDGRRLHLVFSGDDCFSVRRLSLVLSSSPAQATRD